jgi:hypothetical protein
LAVGGYFIGDMAKSEEATAGVSTATLSVLLSMATILLIPVMQR